MHFVAPFLCSIQWMQQLGQQIFSFCDSQPSRECYLIIQTVLAIDAVFDYFRLLFTRFSQYRNHYSSSIYAQIFERIYFFSCYQSSLFSYFLCSMESNIIILVTLTVVTKQIMLGIGHRLQKETKKKILMQKAKQYNTKYDQLIAEGKDPAQTAKILSEEDFKRRHQVAPDPEPYTKSKQINQLGGSINLGYTETHKTMSETKAFYKPIEETLQQRKTQKIDPKQTMQNNLEFSKMKERIRKDHLQEDAQIDYGDIKRSEYNDKYIEDEKLKSQVRKKDKQYNQWQNDLKDYAESYIKSKSSLRKC